MEWGTSVWQDIILVSHPVLMCIYFELCKACHLRYKGRHGLTGLAGAAHVRSIACQQPMDDL